MRCSKANRPSVYPLRELPAGARQCGVPDVYLLASSRAEKGPIRCRSRVGADGRHRYQGQRTVGSARRGCLSETAKRVVPRKVNRNSFRLLQGLWTLWGAEAFLLTFSRKRRKRIPHRFRNRAAVALATSSRSSPKRPRQRSRSAIEVDQQRRSSTDATQEKGRHILW